MESAGDKGVESAGGKDLNYPSLLQGHCMERAEDEVRKQRDVPLGELDVGALQPHHWMVVTMLARACPISLNIIPSEKHSSLF